MNSILMRCIGMLGFGLLMMAESPVAYADLPTISLGPQCGTHSFFPSPEYKPDEPLSACGLMGEISLLDQSSGKQLNRHHMEQQLSWRALHRETNLFGQTLSMERDAYDIGLSYHYALWPMLHPYMLVSAGLAYDTLKLSFTEEFSAKQDALLHVSAQLGVEFTLAPDSEDLGGGIRLLYIFEYTAQQAVVLHPHPSLPNSQGVTLGEPSNLGHGLNIVFFISF